MYVERTCVFDNAAIALSLYIEKKLPFWSVCSLNSARIAGRAPSSTARISLTDYQYWFKMRIWVTWVIFFRLRSPSPSSNRLYVCRINGINDGHVYFIRRRVYFTECIVSFRYACTYTIDNPFNRPTTSADVILRFRGYFCAHIYSSPARQLNQLFFGTSRIERRVKNTCKASEFSDCIALHSKLFHEIFRAEGHARMLD